jgi:hypothetical protein
MVANAPATGGITPDLQPSVQDRMVIMNGEPS